MRMRKIQTLTTEPMKELKDLTHFSTDPVVFGMELTKAINDLNEAVRELQEWAHVPRNGEKHYAVAEQE